jgi:hypothetical protein
VRKTWAVEIIHGKELETRQILERKGLDEDEARRLFENAGLLPGAIWRSLWRWEGNCGQLIGCGWLNGAGG